LTWLEADIDDYIRRKAAERGQPRLLVSEAQEGTDAKVVRSKVGSRRQRSRSRRSS
jgi:hypothetical protein